MTTFLYTGICEANEDEEATPALDFMDVKDNPLTDVIYAIQDAKSLIEEDADKGEDSHDCPIARMYAGLVDAR